MCWTATKLMTAHSQDERSSLSRSPKWMPKTAFTRATNARFTRTRFAGSAGTSYPVRRYMAEYESLHTQPAIAIE